MKHLIDKINEITQTLSEYREGKINIGEFNEAAINRFTRDKLQDISFTLLQEPQKKIRELKERVIDHRNHTKLHKTIEIVKVKR